MNDSNPADTTCHPERPRALEGRDHDPRSPGRWRKLMPASLIFQTGLILGLVLSNTRIVPLAVAQIVPDPAQQQIQTNELLRSIDGKLSKISDLLSSGDAKVKVTNLSPEKK